MFRDMSVPSSPVCTVQFHIVVPREYSSKELYFWRRVEPYPIVLFKALSEIGLFLQTLDSYSLMYGTVTPYLQQYTCWTLAHTMSYLVLMASVC